MNIHNINIESKKTDAINIECKCKDDLPKPPFTIGLFGPSRSGKSTLLEHLFTQKHLLKDAFRSEDIFIISPSLEFNTEDFRDICPPNNMFYEFSNNLIEEIVKEQQLCIKTYGKKNSPNICIIMDDVFDCPSFHSSNALAMLSFRGRHMKISIVAAGQKASSCSRAVRLNLTGMCWFMPSNFSELDHISYEYCEKTRRQELVRKFKDIWKEDKYQFIYFDLLNKNSKRKIRCGFSNEIDYDALD